ncbi:MAG: glycosyltransferase [Bacteroidales bacterium]|nr:glycosyltransferase [Bacteroidales bacterium]MCF8406209.1 glycosyltransferase [Bacteroidales bacterium]
MKLLVFYILIISLSYFCLIIFFLYKWAHYRLKESNIFQKAAQISLLIPVFNEWEDLLKLLASLSKQSIGSNNFEIVIINDHSINIPRDLLLEKRFPGLELRLIHNQYEKGKKNALLTGVEHARNSFIVCTDADCLPHKKWLETLQQGFIKHKAKLISAPVVMTHDKSFLQKFQSFEFSSLVVSGAASIAAGMPIMCNGANLAFKKELFIEAFPELMADIKTGDDIFLLEFTKKHYPEEIIFLKDRNAIVSTTAESGYIKFFKQRIRWTSKSLFYKDPAMIFVSSLVFLVNLNIVITTGLSVGNIKWLYLVFFQYGIKSIADFMILNDFHKFIRDGKAMRMFPVVQLVYPFYILFVSIIGIFKSFAYKIKGLIKSSFLKDIVAEKKNDR